MKVNRVGDRVDVAGPFRLNLFGSDSVDVVVEVPEGSHVEARVKYGSARLAGPSASSGRTSPTATWPSTRPIGSSSRAGTASSASRTSPVTRR